MSHPAAGISLRLSHVSKIFPGNVQALGSVSLEIPSAQFLSILGPSGCGKSTLLRIIAGLERASSGTVESQLQLNDGRTHTAFVFQDAHLLPWRDVLRNVVLPLELMHQPKPES